jgi:hypothetical protein
MGGVARLAHRVAKGIALGALLGLLVATTAAASVRYAAPGANGKDPCSDAKNPCPLYLAAGRNNGTASTIKAGDKVVLAPGLYQEEAGDLSPAHTVWIKPGVTVEGATGPFKSVVSLHSSAGYYGAFVIEGEGVEGHDTVLKDVEIESSSTHSDLTLVSGVVEDVVARSTAGPIYGAIVCEIYDGVLRDSACITEGSEASAVGVMTANQAEAHKIGEDFHLGSQLTPVLRNVTAIGSGPKTRGLGFKLERETGIVDATNVIAKGTEFDALAIAEDNASVTIEFDHSAFDPGKAGTKTTTGGTAAVNGGGANGNIAAAPVLASDHIHQLGGSPTVDAGAADPGLGAFDLDGEQRSIGTAPDIGADELGHQTASAVSCDPATLQAGEGATTCTATVADLATGGSPPTGSVVFATASGGKFTPNASCELAPTGPASASCSLGYAPLTVNGGAEVQTIQASYGGSLIHDRSHAFTAIEVELPAPAAEVFPDLLPLPSVPSPRAAPDTRLDGKPPKRTRKHVARFAFSATGASSFECRLDDAAFRPCVSPQRLRGLSLGRHRFQVRALDDAGFIDPTPAVYRWRVLRR